MKLTPKQIELLFGTWSGEFMYAGKICKEDPRCRLLDFIAYNLGNELSKEGLKQEFNLLESKILAAAYPNTTTDAEKVEITTEEITPCWEKISSLASDYYHIQEILAKPISKNRYHPYAMGIVQISNAFRANPRDLEQEESENLQTANREAALAYTPVHKIVLINESLKQLTNAKPEEVDEILQKFIKKQDEIIKIGDKKCTAVDQASYSNNSF